MMMIEPISNETWQNNVDLVGYIEILGWYKIMHNAFINDCFILSWWFSVLYQNVGHKIAFGIPAGLKWTKKFKWNISKLAHNSAVASLLLDHAFDVCDWLNISGLQNFFGK